LSFKYSSTFFGLSLAHHQELKNCTISLWFYRCNVVASVLLIVVGLDHDQTALLVGLFI
jgi:hypothetical protein